MLLCSQGEIQRIISEQTSGTTGAGKRVFYTEGDCEHTIELFMAGLGEFIYPGSRTMVAMPFSGPSGLGELIADTIRRIGAHPLLTGNNKTYGELKTILEEERPDTYVGMPTALLSMLRMCGKGSIKRALIRGCLSGNSNESNRKNFGNTTLASLWFQRDGTWGCDLLSGS